ncbi:MAG: PorT family protein, partial [Bacteroidales bacterium]|nr:PorT family protein [Bacteroidales bacterium]
LMYLLQVNLFAQQFDGGILAGGVVSQVDGDNWAGFSKVGFLAGGFVNLELSPHSSLQLEMEYIQKGSRKPSYYQENDFHDYLLRLHYLEIPLLYQFTFLKRIQVEAGPAADVLLGYQEQVDGQEVPNDYPFRRVTLAGIVGASGYITKHLKATFRFNYSLLSIRHPQPVEVRPTVWRKILFEWGQYNNVMSLSVAYQFKGRRNW